MTACRPAERQDDADVACGAWDSVLSEPGWCGAATEPRDETAALPTPVQVVGESRALGRAARGENHGAAPFNTSTADGSSLPPAADART